MVDTINKFQSSWVATSYPHLQVQGDQLNISMNYRVYIIILLDEVLLPLWSILQNRSIPYFIRNWIHWQNFFSSAQPKKRNSFEIPGSIGKFGNPWKSTIFFFLLTQFLIFLKQIQLVCSVIPDAFFDIIKTIFEKKSFFDYMGFYFGHPNLHRYRAWDTRT